MPYSLNPFLPKVRAKAITLVRYDKWSISKVARYLGVNRSTIHRWLNQVPDNCVRPHVVPTKSSRPKTHPKAIGFDLVQRIVSLRLKHNECGQIIHKQLERVGIKVGLSTVQRVLKRNKLIKEHSPWKKYHLSGERPKPNNPGDLVQIDTIHIMTQEKKRIYLYTLLDVHSRWAYAYATKFISAGMSLRFFQEAQKQFGHPIACAQSDHGPEFSRYFTVMMGTRHRHTRVRKPNDNAHLERFNRTIQEALHHEIIQYQDNLPLLNRKIKTYLKYYNSERLHMGLDFKTPMEVLQRS